MVRIEGLFRLGGSLKTVLGSRLFSIPSSSRALFKRALRPTFIILSSMRCSSVYRGS